MALSTGGVVGPWPFDIKKRSWSKSELLFKMLGYKKEWLPEIVESGKLAGKITADAGKITNLPPGLPVFACSGDKQAETLGAGLVSDAKNTAAVSLGTGSSISMPFYKPVVSGKYHWFTLAAAEPRAFYLEYLVFRGMWTARWFARELAKDLEISSVKTKIPSEAILCEEAQRVQAGCEGLMVWPRWSPTLQYPNETGSVMGLREIHTRGHFFRALLEGIAFDLRRGKEILEKATGSKINKIYVGGGGARAELAVTILADVLGVPAAKPTSEELAARGAAIVTTLGLGLYATPKEAISAMVKKAPVIKPNKGRMAVYDNLYKKVFLPRLKDCGKTIFRPEK